MAKITRYNGNLKAFASDATGTERTIFGDTAQSDELDANITVDLLRGWGVIGVDSNPTKQHFNGLAFTLGQLISYLHQRGVPEWNAAQEYYEGSVVTTLAGIYRLKSGGVGSSDPDTDGGINWELIPTQAKVDAKADQATTYTETEVDGLLDDKANISGQIFTGEINYRGAGGDTTNTGYGENVLQNNTTGNENTANGKRALQNNTTGNSNTANGRAALVNNTTGNNNTACGYDSGTGIETGSGNSIFGANVSGLAPDLTDNLILASGGVIRLQHDGVGTTTVQGDLVAENLSGTNTGDQTKSDIDALNVDADTLDGQHASAFLQAERRKTGQLALTQNTVLTWNHNEGAVPDHAWASLVCVTAELGYSVGDEIDQWGFYDSSEMGSPPVVKSANKVQMSLGNFPPYVVRLVADNSADYKITTRSSWRIQFHAIWYN